MSVYLLLSMTYSSAQDGEKRPFMWDNGAIIDMGTGSEFAQEIEALGYAIERLSNFYTPRLTENSFSKNGSSSENSGLSPRI
jgi:hypothetical protein